MSRVRASAVAIAILTAVATAVTTGTTAQQGPLAEATTALDSVAALAPEGPGPRGRTHASGEQTTPASAVAAPPRSGAGRERNFVGGDQSIAHIERALRTEPALAYRPVGTTSLVYKTVLRGPINAAFKPASHQHPNGYLAEVAAYRTARLLGMTNVPPVVARIVTREELSRLLDPDFADAWSDIDRWTLWGGADSVPGAAIYWVPRMRSFDRGERGALRRWTEWLSQQSSGPPPTRRMLASDVQHMIAFDFLIANWDRFSGGNIQVTESGKRLFIRDHNVAFGASLRPELQRRLLRHLRRVQRFSRHFAEALQALDETTIREHLGRPETTLGEPLLTEPQIEGLLARRATLLSYITALTDHYGQERVFTLPFPAP